MSFVFAGFPETSLSDPGFNDVLIDTLSNGQININNGAAVPEPSSLVLVLTAGSLLWAGFRIRQLS